MKYGQKELIDAMALVSGVKKIEAEEAFKMVKAGVKHLVANEGDILDLRQFVRFEKKGVPARKYRNPQTGEAVYKEATVKTVAQAKF